VVAWRIASGASDGDTERPPSRHRPRPRSASQERLDATLLEFLIESERPPAPAPFDLDATLLEFLLDSDPPQLELGSVPPDVTLGTPRRGLTAAPVPREATARVEYVRVPDLVAPPRAEPAPPPPPPATPQTRAKKLLKQLERVGPGLEAPFVQSLLELGPDVLPEIAEAFPGLLWFNRNLPHRAVARGRDVSPVARTLVAFGEIAAPTVEWLMTVDHPDIRFYALLVARDLASDDLVPAIAQATLDEDQNVREVAAASILGLGDDSTDRATQTLRSIVGDLATPRRRILFGINALTRLRDPAAAMVFAKHVEATDREIAELALRALSLLTGQALGKRTAAWTKWLSKRAGRARAQWLVEGIESGPAALFPWTHRELVDLCGVSLGEADPDDKKQRKALAKAYRKWLDEHGPL